MENEEYMQCPYETSHRILKARFQVHLGRCRRNHLNVPKVTCPFNVCHILNKPELDWHVATCPERASFEKFRHKEISVISTVHDADNSTHHFNATSDECWDDDNNPTYNPQSYSSTAPVLRNLQGVSASQKKQFRKQERLRLLGIKD